MSSYCLNFENFGWAEDFVRRLENRTYGLNDEMCGFEAIFFEALIRSTVTFLGVLNIAY